MEQFLYFTYMSSQSEKALLIIGINIILVVGMYLTMMICTRGIKYGIYTGTHRLFVGRVNKNNIDRFPDRYFRKRAYRRYISGIFIVLVGVVEFLLATLICNADSYIKPGLIIYTLLLSFMISVVPFIGREKSFLYMILFEADYREFVKQQKDKKNQTPDNRK